MHTTLLPWHKPAFSQLLALHDQQRLGHAWLLSGFPGIGKLLLARHLARTLLCDSPVAGEPCGSCTSCHLFGVGNHPDFRQFQPEKKQLTIDQVRDSIELALNTSQRGGMQILLFEPAEAMNQNAANALLKLLEEPPARTLLLLVSHQPGLLLPTIRSRCQQLRCPLPPIPQAAAWLLAQGLAGDPVLALQRAGGAPLRALHESEADTRTQRLALLDCLQGLLQRQLYPVEAAKKCEKSPILASIDYLLHCTGELLGSLQSGMPLRDPDLQGLLDQLQGDARIMPLHGLCADLQRARRVALGSNNANPQLMLEMLFAHWQQAASGSGRRTSTAATA